MSTQVFFIRALQIIVTVPALLDLLLSHSRAWLPREESRPFPTSSSGIRDSSRAPDTRAGMTENSTERTCRVTILGKAPPDGLIVKRRCALIMEAISRFNPA